VEDGQAPERELSLHKRLLHPRLSKTPVHASEGRAENMRATAPQRPRWQATSRLCPLTLSPSPRTVQSPFNGISALVHAGVRLEEATDGADDALLPMAGDVQMCELRLLRSGANISNDFFRDIQAVRAARTPRSAARRAPGSSQSSDMGSTDRKDPEPRLTTLTNLIRLLHRSSVELPLIPTKHLEGWSSLTGVRRPLARGKAMRTRDKLRARAIYLADELAMTYNGRRCAHLQVA